MIQNMFVITSIPNNKLTKVNELTTRMEYKSFGLINKRNCTRLFLGFFPSEIFNSFYGSIIIVNMTNSSRVFEQFFFQANFEIWATVFWYLQFKFFKTNVKIRQIVNATNECIVNTGEWTSKMHWLNTLLTVCCLWLMNEVKQQE